jgi:uncharacterized membrane protein YgdD (TMEM256/DUF423 family)
MNKTFLTAGAILAGIGVALGAFGAHGLKKFVPEETIRVFQTGVQYQMIHSLALLITGMLQEKFSGRFIKNTGLLFIAGILLFSGSLYLISFLKAMEITSVGKIGLITPLGGICFIAGWICLFLAIASWKK